jgi:hypothetical protein
VRYLFKPIEVAKAYRLARTPAVDEDPRRATELNSEVRDLYGGLAEMRKMAKGIRYHGALHNGGRRDTPAMPRNRRPLVPSPTYYLKPRPTGDEQSFAE